MAIQDNGPATGSAELLLGGTAGIEVHIGGPFNPENAAGTGSLGTPGGGAIPPAPAGAQFSGLNPLAPIDQNAGALSNVKSAGTTNTNNGSASVGGGAPIVAINTANAVPGSGVFIRFQNPA